MKDQIDCQVGTGAYYRFTLFKEGRSLSPMGGNFIYVREGEGGPEVLYSSETDNLAMHAQERWTEAVQRHGAMSLYTRLNVSSAVRRRENVELLQAYDPPMNAEAARRSA